MTSSDLGLSLRCLYALGDQTVEHAAGLNVDGQLQTTAHQTAVVRSPNVTMSITDRQGNDITTAQVSGRPLHPPPSGEGGDPRKDGGRSAGSGRTLWGGMTCGEATQGRGELGERKRPVWEEGTCLLAHRLR